MTEWQQSWKWQRQRASYRAGWMDAAGEKRFQTSIACEDNAYQEGWDAGLAALGVMGRRTESMYPESEEGHQAVRLTPAGSSEPPKEAGPG